MKIEYLIPKYNISLQRNILVKLHICTSTHVFHAFGSKMSKQFIYLLMTELTGKHDLFIVWDSM